ncbi:MAG: A24 family peptidase [Planctomycetaceae bacterium]|nr:A24 family peptidase [Planctomycetaceae bacterium]
MMQEAHAVMIQWGVVLGASLAAALWDLKDRRIPNMLTIPVLVGGLAWSAIHGGGAGFIESLEAAGLLALPYVLLFVFAGGGAGDAKLMAALGAWLGLENGIATLVCVCIFGVILALLKAAWHKQFFAVLANIRTIILTFMTYVFTRGACKANALEVVGHEQTMKMPYGPAIFAGVLAAAVYQFLATD